MSNKLRWKTMFLQHGRLVSQHNQEETWAVGRWRHLDVTPKLCRKGFHCSKRILDAMGYVKGNVIARVEVRGASDIQLDKEAYASMRIKTVYAWGKEDSVALAVFAARKVLHIFESDRPGDDRPRKAIEDAERYLATGHRRDASLPAAAYAAYDAAAYAAYVSYAAAADAAAYAAYAANAAAAAAAYAAYDAAYADAAYAADAALNAAANAADAAQHDSKATPEALVREVDTWIHDRIANKGAVL